MALQKVHYILKALRSLAMKKTRLNFTAQIYAEVNLSVKI